MSRHIFPYGIKFQEIGRVEVFPAAEIFISGKGGHGIRTIFHIDSGATTSIMPSSDIKSLGINKEEGDRATVQGITKELLTGRRHIVMLHLDDRSLKIPVIFVEHDETPRILGREGVFPHFAILFDEVKRRTAFLENKTERKNIDPFFE